MLLVAVMVVSALSAIGLTTTVKVKADERTGEIALSAPAVVNNRDTFTVAGNLHYLDGRAWPKQYVTITIAVDGKSYEGSVWTDSAGNFQAGIDPSKMTWWLPGQDAQIYAMVWDEYAPTDFWHPIEQLTGVPEHAAWSNCVTTLMTGPSQLSFIQDTKCGASAGQLGFHGALTDLNGNPIPQATIVLKEWRNGEMRETTVSDQTDANGNYQLQYAAQDGTKLAVYFYGDGYHEGSNAWLTVNSNHKTEVSLSSPTSTAAYGTQFKISGDVTDWSLADKPFKADLRLEVTHDDPSSPNALWESVKTIQTEENGHYERFMTTTTPIGGKSVSYYRVTFEGDDTHCWAQSPVIKITVLVY